MKRAIYALDLQGINRPTCLIQVSSEECKIDDLIAELEGLKAQLSELKFQHGNLEVVEKPRIRVAVDTCEDEKFLKVEIQYGKS